MESKDEIKNEIKDTTTFEIIFVYSILSILSYLFFLLFNLFKKNYILQSKRLNVILALIFQAFPITIVYTILGEYVYTILGILVFYTALALLLFLSLHFSKIITHVKKSTSWYQLSNLQITLPGQHLPFLTNFRVYFTLETIITILAVDFSFFPHRFLKTETYGLGIMDIGVGLFSYINGLTSAHGRKLEQIQGFSYFKKSFHSALPLILLGLGRMTLITITGYHSSITEYGVHWNFFLTLAFSKIVTSLILSIIPPRTSGLIGLLLIICYQTILSYFNLDTWLMSEQRDSLFMANKEGIVSLVGFVAIYLFGVDLGRFLHTPRTRFKSWAMCALLMLVTALASLCLFNYLHYGPLPASRRIANLSYCLWINCLFRLSIFIEIVLFLFKKILISLQLASEIPVPFWDIINQHLLFFFLLANILTGAVNLSFKTEACSRATAVIIVCLYISIVISGCFLWDMILKKYKARVKKD